MRICVMKYNFTDTTFKAWGAMPHRGSTLLVSTMSSGSKATPDTLPPHITNGVEGVGAPANSINAIKSLLETVRELASQPDYKLIANHFNEITRFQSVIETKDKELEAHKTVNGTLANERLSLNADIKERNDAIAELKKKQESLQNQVRQLEETSNKQKEAMKKSREKIKDLENSRNQIETRAKGLEKSCSQEKSKVLQLEEELSSVKVENVSLDQNLKASDRRLTELESFAVQLHEEDLEKS